MCYYFSMPPRKFFVKRLAQITIVVLLLLFGAAAGYLLHRRLGLPPRFTPAPIGTSNAGILPDLPVPAGWSVKRIDASRLVFTRENAGGSAFGPSPTIDADAFKTASGDVEGSLRLICQKVHAYGNVE